MTPASEVPRRTASGPLEAKTPAEIVAHGRDLAHQCRRAIFFRRNPAGRRIFETVYPGWDNPPWLVFETTGIVKVHDGGDLIARQVHGEELDRIILDKF